MNNIFPFVPRTVAGDWTASERARLLELADHLSAKGVPVEVVFGQTDAGDPWCVVTDEQQDVLVHVARIDGRFVIHDAAVDIIRQVNSLWGAVRQVLVATGVEQRGDVVVAFSPPGREAQTFLALVIAVGFYLENHVAGGGADSGWDFEVPLRDARPQTYLLPSAMIAALHDAASKLTGHSALGDATEAAAPAALTAKSLSTDVAAPASSAEPAAVAAHKATPWAPPAPAEDTHTAVAALLAPTKPEVEGFAAAKMVLTGGPGADVLIGGPGGDIIHGGGGDDYIDGAGAKAGETDQLYGDAGNDKIVLGERVVATGGAGADTFIVSTVPTPKAAAPAAAAAAEPHASLLGVVLDFSTPQGDRLVFNTQAHVTVVDSVSVTDVWTARGDHLDATALAVAGARVGFDFDGDGVEDGFVLLGGADAGAWKAGDAGDTTTKTTDGVDHSGSAPSDPALIGHAPSAPADGDLMRN